MKRRTKKNSNMRRLTKVSQYVLKDLAIVYTLEQKATFINIRTLKPIAATNELVVAAKEVQHPWVVYVAVMLENSVGQKWIKPAECTPERRCYQEDMLDNLNHHHVKLIESTKMTDRVNTGWVAVPSGIELSEEKINDLLECLPCWDVYERGSIKTDKEKRAENQAVIRKLEAI